MTFWKSLAAWMPRVMSCFFLLNLACEWCVIKCVCVCVCLCFWVICVWLQSRRKHRTIPSQTSFRCSSERLALNVQRPMVASSHGFCAKLVLENGSLNQLQQFSNPSWVPYWCHMTLWLDKSFPCTWLALDATWAAMKRHAVFVARCVSGIDRLLSEFGRRLFFRLVKGMMIMMSMIHDFWANHLTNCQLNFIWL